VLSPNHLLQDIPQVFILGIILKTIFTNGAVITPTIGGEPALNSLLRNISQLKTKKYKRMKNLEVFGVQEMNIT